MFLFTVEDQAGPINDRLSFVFVKNEKPTYQYSATRIVAIITNNGPET